MRSFFRPVPALAALATLLAAAPTSTAGQSLADHTYTAEAIQAGARVYATECALCHGPNGERVDGINLRRQLFRSVRSDDDLRRVVTNGVGGSRMPAIALNPSELDGVVAFIRAGFDPEGVAVRVGDAERGRAIFEGQGRCTQCHRVHGQGGRRVAPDLSHIGLLRTPAQLQRTILDPTGGLMPMNRPVRAVTRDGEAIRGRRLNEDTYSIQLVDSNERLRSLVKADLAELEVRETASMPTPNLTPDQVADLIGYLLTLQGLPPRGIS